MELNISKIEKIRKYKGFNQTAFAEKIGISISAYKNLLKTKDFRTEQLIKISEILGISMQNLFSDNPYDGTDEFVVEEAQAEYQTKIKELKKMNKILEERLKDKEEIIKFLKKDND